MAVAMASGSLCLSPTAKAGENCLPGLRCCSLRCPPFAAPIASKIRLSSDAAITVPRAASPTTVEDGSSNETDTIPTPKVIIDQDSDPDATIVEITFGDRLGTLLDTMKSLKNLGLNVVKANVYLDSSGKHNKFAITSMSTGRKIEDPELLEAIRLTIINNMIEYHPESSSQLAMGATFGVEPPAQEVDVDIATHIEVYDDGPDRSLLVVETADYPGLLVDLVKIITDINITVQSGEFDTEGLLAKAKFHVSYRDKPIIKPLQQMITCSSAHPGLTMEKMIWAPTLHSHPEAPSMRSSKQA
ncbi:protein DS12 from 2D-PAGE of leaf, chloroplastic [Musa troglodytarum]|uniref:ACT domain-containing protein ACR n=1 Tax=Musa troglodytarum TaxID=320322 RepID=A0A9E7FRP6_9LILI|nr:protein DS12 from 2D-PAGE of leaf, chloroplastic [Musa troglodytarum]